MNSNIPTEQLLDILLDDLERVDIQKKEKPPSIELESSMDLEELEIIAIDETKVKNKTKNMEIKILKETKKDSLDKDADGSPSKTRLPNLPPKKKEEEKKHIEEYYNMLETYKKKEVEKIKLLEHTKNQFESDQHQRILIWKKQYLMDFENNLNKIYLDLYEGVPSPCRDEIWKQSINSRIKTSPTLKQMDLTSFDFLLQRFKQPADAYKNTFDRNQHRIEMQVKTCFIKLKLFQINQPYYTSICNVLKAHAALQPELLIKLNSANLVGILLLNLNAFDAFLAFQIIINNKVLQAFMFNSNDATYIEFMKLFDDMFSKKLPKLYLHFQNIQLRNEMYLNLWIENYFSTLLGLEECLIIWDYIMIVPELEMEILLEISILILMHLEMHLYNTRLDEILNYLTSSEIQLKDIKTNLYNLLMNYIKKKKKSSLFNLLNWKKSI